MFELIRTYLAIIYSFIQQLPHFIIILEPYKLYVLAIQMVTLSFFAVAVMD